MEKIKFNTTLIIMSIVVLTALCTWFIPAGQYDKVKNQDGRLVLVEGSYHQIESSPQNVFDVLKAPMDAFKRKQTAEIIAFLLIIGGAFMVIERTESITIAIKHISIYFTKYKILKTFFIPLTMIMFSLCGATFGMSEEVLIFVPIFMPLALSLGYDSATGMLIPFLGAGAGFASAFMNPFTLGIAQGIAELPPCSGLTLRIVIWIVSTLIAIGFVLLYTKMVAKHPEKSLTYDFDKERAKELHLNTKKEEKFKLTHKLVLLSFVATLILLVVGVLKYEWYITEIGGLFFGLAIVAAICARMSVSEATTAFYDGVRGMAEICFLLALATSIVVIAENGHILDTCLNYMAGIISHLPSVIASWAAFVLQAIINFFIPSGSGKAVLTMPLLAPLSDLIGITRQTMVLAYQFGDGWTNICIPTSPVTIAVLGLAKITYQKWLKFIWPLIAVWFLMSFGFLTYATLINWQ